MQAFLCSQMRRAASRCRDPHMALSIMICNRRARPACMDTLRWLKTSPDMITHELNAPPAEGDPRDHTPAMGWRNGTIRRRGCIETSHPADRPRTCDEARFAYSVPGKGHRAISAHAGCTAQQAPLAASGIKWLSSEAETQRINPCKTAKIRNQASRPARRSLGT